MRSVELDVEGDALAAERVEWLVTLALGPFGIEEGHVSVAFVDAPAITALNDRWRGKPVPTDVLSFPVDAVDVVSGPRELGDVVICPEHTVDLEEAVVHGVLHLCGMDHETDGGEMLALQAQLMEWA